MVVESPLRLVSVTADPFVADLERPASVLDVARQAEQRVRLHVWHHKVHVMHVAHMKAAVACDRLVPINTTMNWPKRAVEHQAASARYGSLRHDMETWRVEHPADDTPPDDVVKAWMQRSAEAEQKPPVVGWRALRHATKYVTDQPLEAVW
jgi:hypothetical protein